MNLRLVNYSLACGLCLVIPGRGSDARGAEQKVDPGFPIVQYHFRVSSEFSGGEDIWINKVYLGKMPFTITREEFKAKVPFLQEPPQGYVDGNKHQLQGHWFEFKFFDFVPPPGRPGAIPHQIQDLLCPRQTGR